MSLWGLSGPILLLIEFIIAAVVACACAGRPAVSWRGIVLVTHLAREGRMTVTIGRRELLAVLGGAAATWPLAARAQPPAIQVIGFLSTLSPTNMAANVMNDFRQGLKEAGFVEGQNVKVEYRWAEGHYDRLQSLAADLVRRQVAVIAATGGEPSPQVVKAATQTIPIVFMANGDPVAAGLVASLNRPGGNLTGVTIFGMIAAGKRLELLRQLMPKAGPIGYLMNPDNPNRELDNVQDAARSLGQQIRPAHPVKSLTSNCPAPGA